MNEYEVRKLEKRLRAMELTHQDLRDKIEKLEEKHGEMYDGFSDRFMELEQKLKNADVILDLNKKIKELETSSTNCEECKIIHLCPKHYEFCAPSGYENDYQHIVNIFKGKIGKLEKRDASWMMGTAKRIKELGVYLDELGIVVNTHADKLKELEQLFNLHMKDSMSHHDIDKELVGLVKKNEKLEKKIEKYRHQVIMDYDKIKTLSAVLKVYQNKVDQNEINIMALGKLDGGEPQAITLEDQEKYWMKKEEQEAFKPKLPFHDYIQDRNLQEYLLERKEANPKIITIDEAKEKLKKHVEQIKQELKERNEREDKEAEPEITPCRLDIGKACGLIEELKVKLKKRENDIVEIIADLYSKEPRLDLIEKWKAKLKE